MNTVTVKWSELSVRDRDDLVAKELFGWERKMCLPYGLVFGKDGQMTAKPDWSPSTDMRAAWEVVEKMKSLGWNMVELNNALIQFNDDHWHYVHFCDGSHHIRRHAPTAPGAICIAALRALGVQIE